VHTGPLQYVKGVVLGGKLQGGGQRTEDGIQRKGGISNPHKYIRGKQGMPKKKVRSFDYA